jgi:hypothetical protein
MDTLQEWTPENSDEDWRKKEKSKTKDKIDCRDLRIMEIRNWHTVARNWRELRSVTDCSAWEGGGGGGGSGSGGGEY